MGPPANRAGLIPLEHELQERLAWFVRLRWMAAAGIFLGAWAATTAAVVEFSPLPLYGVGLAVAIYNALIAFSWRLFRGEAVPPAVYRRSIYVQIALDWVALVFLVHYAGGIRSPAVLAFAFHLIIGAILLSRRACYVQAGFASLLSGGLAAIERLGLWVPVATGLAPCSLLDGFYHWLALSGFFVVTAFLTTSITGPLRQKEEALFDSERKLERAYAELQALDEERAWFARTTHHQLRSPLAAIQGMLDALPFAGPVSPGQTDLIERGRRRVEELLDMIRDLLDLAAAQHTRTGQEAERLVLQDCLEEVLKVVEERAASRQVDLEVGIPAEQVVVYADPEDIRRIFSNLLDNAVKYTPAGGRVVFRVEEHDGQIRAEVSDTGIGIAPADQERVFQGFYRTRAAKATGELGTGLGLSIARRLVERWDGRLELQSTPGQGSLFTVELPGEIRN